MRTLHLLALPAVAAFTLVACEQTINTEKSEPSSAPAKTAPPAPAPAEKKDDPSFSLEVEGSDGAVKIQSD